MKKRILSLLIILVIVIGFVPTRSITSAATYDDIEYEIIDGEVTITGCDSSISGDVTIPKEIEGYPVTSIGGWSFNNCHNITSVEIPDGVTTIGTGAFFACRELKNVIIPNSVTTIDYCAFDSCESLTYIDIPAGITNIGDDVFSYCSLLTNISVNENNTKYCSENGVLFNKDKTEIICYPAGKKSESYTIPKSVITISNSAFEDCDFLKSVIIGDNITTINGDAFRDCSLLENLNINESITYIGDRAFYQCESLNNINVSLNNSNYSDVDGVLFNKLKTVLICCPGGKSGEYAIPDGITTIKGEAFAYCEKLTSIIIPDSVTSIETSAFANCISLKNINIPDSITCITYNLFSFCSSLVSLTIPESVTKIVDGAFQGCASLENINIPDSITVINGSVFRGCSSLFSIEIPDSVTSIEREAFSGCKGLVTIDIPDSVTSIGEYAFSYCENLTSVTIPNSVTSIGDSVFYSCTSLKEITIPDSITSIGDFAFGGCTSLTNVTIPNSVISIGYGAFKGCTSLKEITIPNSVTSIGEYAFSYCENLTSITIPDSVTSIGEYTFSYCKNLTSITISDSVTSIGVGSFAKCKSLRRIEIPKNISTIKSNTFSDSALKVLYLPKSVKKIEKQAFEYSDLKFVYYEGTQEERDNIVVETFNESFNNATWIYEQNGLPEHEYENDCDNFCEKCGKLRVVPNHNNIYSCDKVNCAYTKVVDENELETILNAISDTINLNIPESEHKKAKDLIYQKIEEILKQKKIKYQYKDGMIYLGIITETGRNLILEVYTPLGLGYSSSSIFDAMIRIGTPNHFYSNDDGSWSYDSFDVSVSKNFLTVYTDTDFNILKYIRNLKLESVQYFILDIDTNKWVYSKLPSYEDQLNDNSLTLETYSNAGGYNGLNLYTHGGVVVEIYKNGILYDIKHVGNEYSVPLITVPYEISDNDTYDYVVKKITDYNKEVGESITAIEKTEKIFEYDAEDAYIVYSETCEGGDGYVIIKKDTKCSQCIYDNSCDTDCNRCKTKRVITHTFGNYIYNNDATETADGTKTRTCSVCGHKETIVAEGTKLEKTLINSSSKFIDVLAKAWYKKFVDYSVTYGIFTGTSNNTFSPNTDMTRAQFVQVFANISGVDTSNKNVNSGFSDVPKGKWYTAAVTWAAKNGIVSGVGGGKFDPDAKVTREQMCVMIVNYIENYQKRTLSVTTNAPTFADDAKIAKWAKTAVYKCAKAGLVNGVGNNMFDPKASATRAQGATIFTNFFKEYMR